MRYGIGDSLGIMDALLWRFSPLGNDDKHGGTSPLLVILAALGILHACSGSDIHVEEASPAYRSGSSLLLDLGNTGTRLVGADERDLAGQSVAAGDTNGDGIPDLAIGASANDQWVEGFEDCCQGSVSIVYGPLHEAIGLAEADATIEGVEEHDTIGWSVDVCGDVDGDGYEDVLIGNHGEGAAPAYLFRGPLEGTYSAAEADTVFTSRDGTGGVGWSVAGAGDVDADGLADVVLSNGCESTEGGYQWEALVFLSPGPGHLAPDEADVLLSGETGWACTIRWVDGAGDTNGDGYDDVLVSVESGFGDSHVLLFLGPLMGALGNNEADAEIVCTDSDLGCGFRAAAAGDVNGDGVGDVLVGDRMANDFAGKVYLFHGPIAGTVDTFSADATLVGEESGDAAGFALTGAGDLDQDGYGDVLVGAPGTGEDRGFAYLLYGPLEGEIALETAQVQMTFEDSPNMTGISVAAVGDIDEDGLDDIAVGARQYSEGDQTHLGAVVVLTYRDFEDAQGCQCSATQAAGAHRCLALLALALVWGCCQARRKALEGQARRRGSWLADLTDALTHLHR